MRTHPFSGVISLVFLLLSSSFCQGQSSAKQQLSLPDSTVFFLYIDYCGSRYNKSIRQQELVINAVKLPASVLKKMPRLKDDGCYSSKNFRIHQKQQELIRQYRGEKLVVRINKCKFNAFYPKGLKKGAIIVIDEFNRWNFLENPVQQPPPSENNERFQYWWYWYHYDPVNIQYGLMITA